MRASCARAARVQAESLPGELYVTDAVIDLLGGSYVIDNRRRVELRGVEELVGIGRDRSLRPIGT